MLLEREMRSAILIEQGSSTRRGRCHVAEHCVDEAVAFMAQRCVRVVAARFTVKDHE